MKSPKNVERISRLFTRTKCDFVSLFKFRNKGSTGINGMKTRIFEGEGDAHPLLLQKFGTFPVKNGRAETNPCRRLNGTKNRNFGRHQYK